MISQFSESVLTALSLSKSLAVHNCTSDIILY